MPKRFLQKLNKKIKIHTKFGEKKNKCGYHFVK